MFIRSGSNIEIVERQELSTGERDIGIRIEEKEYSFVEFMYKIRVLVREMQERFKTLRKHVEIAEASTEEIQRKYDELGGIEATEKLNQEKSRMINQALDLSNIK